jgi:uncharacterized membrane protein
METLKLISSYLFTLVAMFVLDMLWIEYVAIKIYKKYLSNILKDRIIWIPVVLFYLIFTLALFLFVVISVDSWLLALQTGTLFGFIVYSIYSLHNASLVKGWNWKVVIFDVLWGTVLTGAISVLAYFIVNAML